MEPIKITDKLTLRQEALRMAAERAPKDLSMVYVLEDAKKCESYILGDAELHEFVDPQSEHKYLADMLGKFQESTQPKPLGFWISADSEMKPSKGVQALCALRYGSKTEYLAMYYDPEEKEWYGGPDDDNTNHVVAWMPILPFVEPLKL